jgi:hypothetical protein
MQRALSVNFCLGATSSSVKEDSGSVAASADQSRSPTHLVDLMVFVLLETLTDASSSDVLSESRDLM